MSSKFNPLLWALKPLFDQAKAEDAEFANEVATKEARAEKPKSFEECCEYIMGEAYEWAKEHREGNFGLAGMPDSEMVGLIKHYYDEDDIEIKKMGAGVKASVSAPSDKKTEDKTPAKKTEKKTESAKSVAENKKNEATTGDLFAEMFS